MPKVFISYSHDDATHKDWVRFLAEKLISAGIEVTLDQWDLGIGKDIASFMEEGIRDHERVIVVCSESYAAKADGGKGGVGYEKQIVTAELVANLDTNKFIPVIRRNARKHVPTFLGYRLYIDFDDESVFEVKLDELQREIYGLPARPKPKLGINPYQRELTAVGISQPAESAAVPRVIGTLFPSSGQRFRTLLRPDSALMDLDDWLTQEISPIRKSLEGIMAPVLGESPTAELLVATSLQVSEIVAPLVPIMALGGQWSTREQAVVVGRALKRLSYSAVDKRSSWYDAWLHVARIPFHIVSSAWMLGVVHRGSFESVAPIFVDQMIHNPIKSDDQSALVWLHRGAPFAQDMWKMLPQKDRLYFPFSAWLEEILKPAAVELGADETEYVRLFDRVEAFLACLFASIEPKGGVIERVWAPLGSFVWRNSDVFQEYAKDLERAGGAWPPTAAGLFGGSADGALKVIGDVEQFVGRVRNQRGIF